MAGTVGVRVSIDGDASGAKRAIDEVNSSVGKLTQSSKNLPTFMGSGVPGFNSNARYMPPLTPGSAPYGSPYGVNSFYGQMSPGGILPDGRKQANTDQRIAQLTDQLEKLGETIKDVNQDLQEARDNKDIRSEYQLSGTLNNLKSTESQVKSELKGLERERDKDDSKAAAKLMGGYLANQIVQRGVSAGNTIVGSQKALASGDALGSAIQFEKGMGSLIGGTIASTLGAVGGGLLLKSPAGAMAGASLLNPVGDFIGSLFGEMSEKDSLYSGQYKNTLPAIDRFYQRYGEDIEKKSGEENSKAGLDWYNQAADISIGTGKTTAELMDAASSRKAYGNFSASEALTGARKDIMWERFTGADLSNIQRIAGLGLRYGEDENAVQSAYAGLYASGMGKGQFDEFLTSMQRIMEDGIEKGFVRGADEIAGNMALLSRLSDGDKLWTGEQGANRLMRMNEAVASATDLSSVEDVLSFGAARNITGKDGAFEKLTGKSATGTYIDEMMILERGVSADLLEEQFKSVRDLEGNNAAGQIERYMKMYNLNYTGGRSVYDMAEKAAKGEVSFEQVEKDIKQFQTDPGYKSDSQNLQDIMTGIEKGLANIGADKFKNMEMPKLQEKVAEIHQELCKISRGEARPGYVERLTGISTAAAPFLDDGYSPINSHFQAGLADILNYKNSNKNDYGESVSRSFLEATSGIDASTMNGELAQTILNFQRKFSEFGVGWFKGGIDEREKDELTGLISSITKLAEELKKNTSATENNTKDDKLNVNMVVEY